MNKPHTIKCSQCDKVFFHGHEYRMHWEKEHLDDALKQVNNNKYERNSSKK